MILKLENTTTHQLYEYEVKDMNNGEKLYFRFDIDTSNLVDGEYALKLYDGDKIIATDILKIGDFNANTLQYKKGENIYIEVKLDESVQDVKNISISTIETTVLPDDGFNSMGKVDVNAQPLYDNAYHIGHTEGYNEGLESSYQVGYDDGYSVGNEEGYNSGYNVGNEDGYKQGKTDGINTQKSKLETISITNNGTYEREDGYNKIIVDVPDTNGSYDEGYAEGISNGLAQGEINGINIQKDKLESITITENGTYTREDGYNSIEVNIEDTNGSYDEGYADGIEEGTSNAGEIIAETARVLEVTENGYYMSRYSEPPTPDVITGVYPDGILFSNYTQLDGKVFNTNITPTPTTRLELWYKGDNKLVGDAYNVIIGAGKKDDSNAYQIRYDSNRNDRIRVELGFNILYHSWDENAWHHILIDKETEDASCMSMWIDEVKVGDFTNYSFYPQSTFYINSIEYNSKRKANGCFGMIKIDDTIIIPTADGFRNTNTGKLLEVVEEGKYVFTDNTPQVPEGNLIKTVKVNVQPKINVAEAGIKFGNSTFKEVPDFYDFSNVTHMNNMFQYCSNLTTIPQIDTSNVINMDDMFYGCSNLTTIPLIDTSNVTSMYRIFYYCGKLATIPELNTSNVTNMNYMFYSCGKLATLPELDVSKVTNMANYFRLGGGSLTDVGGWKNLKINWNDNYGLVLCPNLTYQSCINILNGLADVTELGERTLKVHQNFLTTVGDEISIGTNKGWIITA